MHELLGEDSPGVGKYTPNLALMSHKGAVIGRSKKYYEHPEIKNFN